MTVEKQKKQPSSSQKPSQTGPAPFGSTSIPISLEVHFVCDGEPIALLTSSMPTMKEALDVIGASAGVIKTLCDEVEKEIKKIIVPGATV